MSKVRVVLVGGGSGGHFYPLMSIAEELLREPKPPRLYYMGPDPYDSAALAEHNITFVSCPAGKKRKYASIHNFFDLFKTLFGIAVAVCKLFVIYPDVVVSKGGYTSVPVVVAAWFLMIPIIVHESDAVPGTANKIGGKFARYIGVAYEETIAKFPSGKAVLVGIPIRTALLAPSTVNPRARLGVGDEYPLLLILGGSQGAERVNELILDSLDELLPHFSIVHQTGKANFDLTLLSASQLITDTQMLSRYHPIAFLDASLLNDALHAATIIISRAGSGTIHEIAVHGKPAILIPIPEEISHDQRTNAYAYARSGGATVMEEKNLKDDLLLAEIGRIMGDQVLYTHMSEAAIAFGKRTAAAHMCTLIRGVTDEH